MKNRVRTTAMAAVLVLSGPVLAQSSATTGSGTTAGGGAAQMQAQVPAGPLPMTQPAPGTASTSQRPSTAAGALGATSGKTGSGQAGSGQSALMTENDVRERLRSEGYSDLQSVSRDGNTYRARAMQNGRSVDLTIDADTGTIRNQAARR